jgi:sialate O-acetylesterase
LLLRLFSSTEKPGILTPQSAAGPIPLDGDWEYLMEKSLSDPAGTLSELPKAPERNPQAIHTASYLFNGQIAPIIPYAIKGVIWYQGEFNASKGYQYRKVFPLLINDWRSQWKQGDFPFYFCQLPNFKPKLAEPSESAWAELREAQSLALALPNTGMATLIDIGEAANLHPTNKRDVGERLARIALAKDYGKDAPYTGPVYDSMKADGNQIVLSFKHTDGGLIAGNLPDAQRNSPSSPLEGFSICGKDRKWVWAHARIQGDQVVVSSDQIPSPLAVRYAWSDNPTCNLTNGSGLPCTPFRTDDFPLTSEKRKFPWN